MVGELVAGRYELEELVGTGGMSSVYRAHDRMLERHVALKILHESHLADAETIERFRREARAVAQLSHPNIVTVIDRGEDGGRQFIVFEYIAGENLKQAITREGPQPVRRVLELGIQVGRGLAFAHSAGLIHRDVKPQNVLLNGDGEAKVTDFGIARSLDVEGVTRTGTVMGTSNYIAPEQATGRPVDAQTDVYALGVVVFELLTGRVPFEGDNFVAVAMRHVSETPPSVLELRPDTPIRLANAVDRALEKAPEYRFPTMDAFVDELELCLAELDGGADADAGATMVVRGPAPSTARPERAPRRRRARRSVWPALVLVVGLLALAGVVAFALLTDDPVGEVRERTPVVGDGGGGGGGAAEGPIELSGIRAYDPFGDNQQEHDDEASQATDGDPSTDWATEGYTAGLQKEGVGLVLDAGKEVEPAELTVHTSSSAFTAEIRSGASPTGPFETVVAGSQQVDGEATFELDGEPARYYVVWITELDGRARITEVTAET